MREIKFRAWDKEIKKMVNPFGNSNGDITFLNFLIEDIQNNFNGRLKLMQFTGLKDKNGKEIYEGDIVQSVDWGQPKRAKGVVIFEGYEWKVTPKNRGSHKTWYEIWSHVVGKEGESVEVIGNIYENPELLERSSTITN